MTEENMKGIVLQLLCFCGKFPDSEVLCKKQLQNQALCTHALVVILKEIEWDQQNGTSAQRKIQRLPSAPWSCSCSELWCAVTFIGWFHQLIYLINLDLTLYKGYVIKWCNSFLSHHTSQDLSILRLTVSSLVLFKLQPRESLKQLIGPKAA